MSKNENGEKMETADDENDEKVENVDDEKMSNDENDSSDDDEMGDDKNNEKLIELNARLESNPFDYQAHVDKIEVLKSLGELDDLRKARESFAELYPLTPALWLDWTKSEISLATSDEEKEKVCSLFERAVKDYVSVDLWLEYCQFVIGIKDGMSKVKDVFERGLAQVGVHATKGALLWEAYREFENVLLTMHPDNTELHEKVDRLFRRQLAVPLLDMENTFEEYNAWLSIVMKKPDANAERQYKNALAMLKKREPFENELLACEDDAQKHLDVYKKYLDFELKDGNPARIQCLMERRVSDHCLEPMAWIEYVSYLDRQLKISTVSLPVYERSVRNCTWNSLLWVKYIRAKERFECSKEEILKLSEQALSSDFVVPTNYRDIWLAYIDYLRRSIADKDENREQFEKDREEIRALFIRALEHVAPIGGDPDCVLARYWASLEADRFRNMEEARKIWADVLVVLGDRANFWQEQIQLEKSFGDNKHIRRVFQRSLEKVKDQPELIGDAWLQFEREEGNLEQFEEAELKVIAKLEKVNAERTKQEEIAKEEQEKRDEKIAKKKEKDLEKRREKRREESSAKKRPFPQKDQKADQPVFKKPNLVKTNMPPPSTPPGKKQNQSSPPGFKADISPPPGFKGDVEPPPGFKGDVAPPPGFKGDVAPPPGFKGTVAPPPGFKGEEPTSSGFVHSQDKEKQIRTVFVSNLDFSAEDDAIKEFMSKSGNVVEVRLVRNPAGKSKGFAYVEFSMESEARAAILRDRELFGGRPMFIAECDPANRAKFKFNTGLEKNKLFVKDLSKDTTQEELEALFGKYGALNQVRLITFRNGHSKGLAYVEFTDEMSASKALVATDGSVVDGRTISVAISNPPTKKSEASDARSLGEGSRTFGARGRGGRSQLAFIPRVVQKATAGPPSNGAASKNGQETNAESAAPKKSNEDFRNMLLGKK